MFTPVIVNGVNSNTHKNVNTKTLVKDNDAPENMKTLFTVALASSDEQKLNTHVCLCVATVCESVQNS